MAGRGRLWTGVLVTLVVATSGLAALPAAAEPSEAALAACARDASLRFSFGVPPGWQVVTAANTDGSASWRRTGDTFARGWRLQSDVRGTGVKDDRLVTPAFVATGSTEVTFQHGYALAPGAGGLLEVSADGGDSWEAVGPARITGHRYQGTTPDGTPAFGGAHPDVATTVAASSTADLSAWSGQEIRVAWRLHAQGPTAPGWWALDRAVLRGIADAACVDGARPELRCTENPAYSFSARLPDGWEVVTAVNESATPPWRRHTDTLPFSGAATDAGGLGGKDDSLVSPPLVATATSSLVFHHRYTLEPGRDGGVLEVTADGGETWAQLGADRFLLGAYHGQLADGRPAWTGTHLAPPETPSWQGYSLAAVDLSPFDGQEVRVRWRLLQDGARPDSLPGRDWLVLAPSFHEVVRDALCAAGGPPARVCSSLDPPAAVSAHGITDDGARVGIGVRVALDVAEAAEIALLARDEPEQAAERMAALEEEMRGVLEPAARPYTPLGIDVELSFDLLAPLDEDGQPRKRPAYGGSGIVDDLVDDSPTYTEQLFALAKNQYGHRPPPGTDAVYVVTDVDMGSLGGQADCVGGIAYPQHSFAMGIVKRGRDDLDAATIAAHEVGHLLGAQHHFFNCAESLPGWAATGGTRGTCTLMSPDTYLARLQFSTVNGAIVRGYALEFAGRA